MTTMKISRFVWKKINRFKRPGESFDDVLRRVDLVEG